MRTSLKTLLAAVLAATLELAGRADAAFFVYTSDPAFTAATNGLTTQNFDTATPGAAPTTVGGVMITDPSGNNGVAISGALYAQGQSVRFSTASSPTVRFTLPNAVTAVGLNIYDLGTVGATNLTFTLSNGETGSLAQAYTGSNANVLFRGITSTTSFTSLTLSNSQVGDFVELDNLRYGAALVNPTVATPAPAGVLFLAAAAGLLGLARRFRPA